MSSFDKVLWQAAEKAVRHARQEDGDYIGPDGLLYCGRCRTAKECRVKSELWGQERTVGCLCKCAAQRRDELQRRVDEGDREVRMRRMRQGAALGSVLSGARFETARPTALIGKAKNYVKNWELVQENNAGLLLMGGVGVGKSYAAACICNALLDRGVSCRMTSFGHILAMGFEERAQFLSRVAGYGLLVLDDLGAERTSEFADEIVFSVIDERYRSKKPLIVTTNLSLKQLKSPQSLEKERVYDRLLEFCGPVLCEGESQRQAGARGTREVLGQVLRGGA